MIFSSNICYVNTNYLLCKYFNLANLAVYKDNNAAYELSKKNWLNKKLYVNTNFSLHNLISFSILVPCDKVS